MPNKLSPLLAALRTDYPGLTFTPAAAFYWNAGTQTLGYNTSDIHAADQLLHELAHAVLAHESYAKDIELLAMERDAWSYAKTSLGPHYDVVIDDETVQQALDSYRDWLHARSTCPTCRATGIEEAKNSYVCLACSGRWLVNDARRCGLKRRAIKN